MYEAFIPPVRTLQNYILSKMKSKKNRCETPPPIFVISRSGSDEKSERSLALLGTWISPCGRNDRERVEMTERGSK